MDFTPSQHEQISAFWRTVRIGMPQNPFSNNVGALTKENRRASSTRQALKGVIALNTLQLLYYPFTAFRVQEQARRDWPAVFERK